MLQLDHITIIAPTLIEGVNHVRACLDIDIPFGGVHPEMGTSNHLLRLNEETFLEVIAIDRDVEAPVAPRWFGLDDVDAVRSAWDDGRRLRAWVARTDDLDAVLADHSEILGRKRRVSRGDRSWFFAVTADGSLPAEGVAPSAMDWGSRGSPAPTMPDLGAKLISFAIEHPDPAMVAKLYELLHVVNPPLVQKGAQLRYRATIDTPHGLRELH
jgi:Glyoxalase-like domain